VATGHDDYKEKMIRIAHLGSTDMGDLERTMDAFEDATGFLSG
jgi:aspartate aminotransferase-like enzyme